MDDWKLFSPRPVAPFLGYSANEIAESIRTVCTPTWCTAKKQHHSYCQPHACSLHGLIDSIVGVFKADMEDAALEEYFSTLL
jgi:hypothetical protein